MPNSVYLLVAYGVFWAFTLILVGSIWARQRRLGREVAALQARLDEDQQ
jgi:heme exporter protein CcmD